MPTASTAAMFAKTIAPIAAFGAGADGGGGGFDGDVDFNIVDVCIIDWFYDGNFCVRQWRKEPGCRNKRYCNASKKLF